MLTTDYNQSLLSKSKTLLVLSLFLLFSGFGCTVGTTVLTSSVQSFSFFALPFYWLKQLGSPITPATSWNYAQAVKTDSMDAVIIAGHTSRNLVTCGGVSANCTGLSQGSTDLYVSKYDNFGNFMWLVQMGETGKQTLIYGLAIDSTDAIYVTGMTTGKLPNCNGVSGACGGGVSQGVGDYFISKYDTNGVWQWTVQLGETGKGTAPVGLAVDSSNNVYVTGNTTGKLTNCNGVSGACAAGVSLTKGDDTFVSKYNSSGAWQWTRQMGVYSTSMFDRVAAAAISVDAQNNIWVGGLTTMDVADCGNVGSGCKLASQGFTDYFILKYDANGNLLFTRELGSINGAVGISAMTVDSSSNVYVTGSASGANLPACGGISQDCSATFGGIFMSKYDLNGNWQWSTVLGGTNVSGVNPQSVVIDSLNNIYITGYTNWNISNCVTGDWVNCNTPPSGITDLFITKYNSSGTLQGGVDLGQAGKMVDAAVATVDSSGSLYVVGPTNANLMSCTAGVSANCSGSSTGSIDSFFAKY